MSFDARSQSSRSSALKRRMFSVIATSVGQAFHARGAEEADDALGAVEHVGGVVGLGDRAAVAEHEHVRVLPTAASRIAWISSTHWSSDLARSARRSSPWSSGPCAGRARRRRPRPSPPPAPGRTRTARSAGRAGAPCAIISTSSPKPMPVSSRFARKVPSISPTVGKFCTPAKPASLDLAQEPVHQPERIGAADARRAPACRSTTGSTSRGHVHARSRWRRRRASARRASRGRPSGSGRSCR